jgi:hypothetical protein
MDYEFWIQLLYGVCAGLMAYRLVEYMTRPNEKRLEREIKEAYEKAKQDMIIDVKIEKHGDIYYLFEKKSDNFIAQGKNLDELKEVCDKRFRRNVIVANTAELEAAGLK